MKKPLLYMSLSLMMACVPSQPDGEDGGWSSGDDTWVRAEVLVLGEEVPTEVNSKGTLRIFPAQGIGLQDEVPWVSDDVTMLAAPVFKPRRVVVRGGSASLGHTQESNPCFPLVKDLAHVTWELVDVSVVGDEGVLRVSDASANPESPWDMDLVALTLHPGAPGEALVRTQLSLSAWPEVTDWGDKTVAEQDACAQHMRDTIGRRLTIETAVTITTPSRYALSGGAEQAAWIGDEAYTQLLVALDERGESLADAINWDACQLMDEVWFWAPSTPPQITCDRTRWSARVEVPLGGSRAEFRLGNGQTLRLRAASEDDISRLEIDAQHYWTRREPLTAHFDEQGTLVADVGHKLILEPQWFDGEDVRIDGMDLERAWIRSFELLSKTPEVCSLAPMEATRGMEPDINQQHLIMNAPGTCEVTLQVVGESATHRASLTLPWRELEPGSR